MQLRFPVHEKDVSKQVSPRYLTPRRGTSWDGWFAIAIFPPGSPARWAKAHLYRCSRGEGWQPLAAVEGFGHSGEVMIAWGDSEKTEVFKREIMTGPIESSTSPLNVSMDGLFGFQGVAPRYNLEYRIPGEDIEAEFDFETHWPIWWSRWGRLLTYAGQHSSVKVEIERGQSELELEGFGVVEHVCGISLPFDFTRFMPFHYHWDVLSFETPGSRTDSAAGLSIGRNGRTVIRLRGAAKIPGYPQRPMQGLSVNYLETAIETSPGGGQVMFPVRWEGLIQGREGELGYRATASTPLAAVIPGGGMLGFDFEAEWLSPGSRTEVFSGTGFCEYGDFSGKLVRFRP